MTAANPTPGVGPEGVTETPETPTQTPGSTDESSPGYPERIRAGGDFAWEENRKHQSRADRMEAENRRLKEESGGGSEALKTLMGQGLTPDMIAAAAGNYFMLRQNPATQEAVLSLEQTGVIPERTSKNPSDDDDEYLTDEQREIRELNKRIEKMQSEQSSLAQSTGSAALKAHLERFASENFLKAEEFEEVMKGMLPQVKQWAGNEQGRNLLRDIQNPNAYDTVETLAWKFVPREVRFQLGERKRLHDQNRMERYRTDVPPEGATSGREPPPEFKSVEETLQWAKQNSHRLTPRGTLM